MEKKTVLYSKSKGVGTITLNRADRLNAINWRMLEEMEALLTEIMEDGDLRVVVLKGEGRYFSAGADLEIVQTLDPSSFRWRQECYWNRVFCLLDDLEKVTIAALNGPAIGGGLELALCCDLRYAVEDAHFSMPEIDYGIVPDAGATVRLPLLLGPSKAKEFVLSGEELDARRADQLGLVNGFFARETFDEEVRRIADKFAKKSQPALGIGKRLIDRAARHRDVRTGLEEAMDAQCYLVTTDHYRKSVESLGKGQRRVRRRR